MFAPQYFAPQYFAPGYFPVGDGSGPIHSPSGGYFPGRYFANRYFPQQYFPGSAGTAQPVEVFPCVCLETFDHPNISIQVYDRANITCTVEECEC